MDDLGTRLAEAADRAAQLARGPGPAAAWRRVRARRRRRAGGAALALMVAALVIAIGRGGGLGLPTVDPLDQDRWRQLPWRGLQAREWTATVPNEQPHDPVVAAAQGEQAGEPWRLVVYRSTYRPGGGRARWPTSATSSTGSRWTWGRRPGRRTAPAPPRGSRPRCWPPPRSAPPGTRSP